MDDSIRFALIFFRYLEKYYTNFCYLTLHPHRKTPCLIVSFLGLINSTELMCSKLSCVV